MTTQSEVHTLHFAKIIRVSKNEDLSQTPKFMLYQAVVIPALLYGCEAWILYQKDLKKLEQFRQRKFRSILNIKWDDYITNISVLEQANPDSVEIMKHQLPWSD